MKEALSSSKTSVLTRATWGNTPEDNILHFGLSCTYSFTSRNYESLRGDTHEVNFTRDVRNSNITEAQSLGVAAVVCLRKSISSEGRALHQVTLLYFLKLLQFVCCEL
jgi:hypothetical protein